ncbi:hypothetical protein GCM10009647_074800 [Streptomyces sanglieri]
MARVRAVAAGADQVHAVVDGEIPAVVARCHTLDELAGHGYLLLMIKPGSGAAGTWTMAVVRLPRIEAPDEVAAAAAAGPVGIGPGPERGLPAGTRKYRCPASCR